MCKGPSIRPNAELAQGNVRVTTWISYLVPLADPAHPPLVL